MDDIETPAYLKTMINDDEFLQKNRTELDKFINHEKDNEIDREFENMKGYQSHEVDI